MNIFKKLFGKKKEEKIDYPYSYIKIVWTDTAIHDGTLDEYNKEIQMIKGREIQIFPYTRQYLESLIEVYKIPYIDMTKLDVEEFKFEEVESLQGIYSEVTL